MSAARRMLVLASMLACGACANETPPRAVAVDPQVAAHLDSTNASLSAIYRARDAKAYGTLFTDSAVFEWPAIPNVRGRAQLENMALENWQSLIGL